MSADPEPPSRPDAPASKRPTVRPTGRPRGFDRDAALDVALELFWARGYDAVSVGDLTEAMGIHSPSFYAAFGSKADLFAEAVRRYEERHLVAVAALLDEAPTAAAAVEAMLRASVLAFTAGDQPPGCLLALGAVNCRDEDGTLATLLHARREANDALIRARLERGMREGDLPPSASPATLAAFLATVSLGLSLQARNGARRDTLDAVVTAALSAFRWTEL